MVRVRRGNNDHAVVAALGEIITGKHGLRRVIHSGWSRQRIRQREVRRRWRRRRRSGPWWPRNGQPWVALRGKDADRDDEPGASLHVDSATGTRCWQLNVTRERTRAIGPIARRGEVSCLCAIKETVCALHGCNYRGFCKSKLTAPSIVLDLTTADSPPTPGEPAKAMLKPAINQLYIGETPRPDVLRSLHTVAAK